jgi:hypothetical protein
VANVGSDNVSILLGDGTGSVSTATNFDTGDAPSSVTIGDFNGNGVLDLAVSNLFLIVYLFSWEMVMVRLVH